MKRSEQSNRWIILLRGINVAGKGILKMKDLQAALVKNGYQNVQTYIQSGNIILDTEMDEDELKNSLKTILKEQFSLEPEIFIVNKQGLIQKLNDCPFDQNLEQNKVFILFTNKCISPAELELLKSYVKDGEEIKLQEGQLYISYPNGMGKSKLTTGLVERKLNQFMTARNLNTVRKLVELLKVKE